MQSKISTFIISIVFVLIIVVLILFGVILWNKFIEIELIAKPGDIVTEIGESKNTIDEDIKTPKIVENPFEGIKDVNTNKNEEEVEVEEVDYSNVTINKYFYNQLEEYSKIIYNAFEVNKENMKTGTYRIELGKTFSPLLEQSDGQDKLGKYYQSAIEAYTYDNPDVFYLSPNKMYLNIETTKKKNDVIYNVYINSGKEENYLINEFSSKSQIDRVINRNRESKR